MYKEEKKNAAMEQLFSGLTSPATATSSSEERPAAPVTDEETSRRRKNKANEDERVCTIINVELMGKIREIARKEAMQIREVFELALKFAIQDYESKNGVIHVRKPKSKKGDASKIFGS